MIYIYIIYIFIYIYIQYCQVLRIVDSEDGDNPVVAVEDSVALAAGYTRHRRVRKRPKNGAKNSRQNTKIHGVYVG